MEDYYTGQKEQKELKIGVFEDMKIVRRIFNKFFQEYGIEPPELEMKDNIFDLIRATIGEENFQRLIEKKYIDNSVLDKEFSQESEDPVFLMQIATNIRENIQNVYKIILTDNRMIPDDPVEDERDKPLNKGSDWIIIYFYFLEKIRGLVDKFKQYQENPKSLPTEEVKRMQTHFVSIKERLNLLEEVINSSNPRILLMSNQIYNGRSYNNQPDQQIDRSPQKSLLEQSRVQIKEAKLEFYYAQQLIGRSNMIGKGLGHAELKKIVDYIAALDLVLENI